MCACLYVMYIVCMYICLCGMFLFVYICACLFVMCTYLYMCVYDEERQSVEK